MANKSGKKSNAGRRDVFTTIIEPNLDKITEWSANGATEKQMCEALGISVSAFNTHKVDKPELQMALKKGRTNLCLELRGELARIALPHTQTTTKTYIKSEDGKETTYTERVEKECDGEIAAIHLLLKNLDRGNWFDNPDSTRFKERELELKEKMASMQIWKS